MKKQKSMVEVAREKAGLEGAGIVDVCEQCGKPIFKDEWYLWDDSSVFWHMKCDWRDNVRDYVDERDSIRKEVVELSARLQEKNTRNRG